MRIGSLFRENVKGLFHGFFTEYETSKVVLIHSAQFAGLLRLTQIIILLYSVGYLLVYEKGYQKISTTVISSITIKVKGIGYVNTAENKTIIVDGADYIIPPSENNAIFIMTNYIQTDQMQSTCAESSKLKEAICTSDSSCTNKPIGPKMNGRWTGRCILSTDANTIDQTANITNSSKGLCEYSGWCPPENDREPTMLVEDILNFTLFIKNFIEFPVFDIKHKNMVDNLKACVFHPKHDPDCPIFSINYIINQAESDSNERILMMRHGGVIRIKIEWDCNLDRKIRLCKPEYSFARLDVPYREKPFSVGFNFRYASKWKRRRRPHRTLTKAFGLRFIIAVSGKAGKFDFITLTLNIGSLVGIFGLATIICDFFLLNISKQAGIYRRHVFEIVHLRTRLNSVMALSRNQIHKLYDQYSRTTSDENNVASCGVHENQMKDSPKISVNRKVTFAEIERVPQP